MRPTDLEAIRARLNGASGRQYWRSLDELADSPEFREMLHREFPPGACEADDSLSRRNFLKLMGASMALAGATAGCYQQPEEVIVPYVQEPEILIPGRPLFFATAFPFRGYGIGALAESQMGRPTKIEGNPDHPASLGATNVFMQASVLTLYDPDRSQVVTRGGEESTWASFIGVIHAQLARLREAGAGTGAGARGARGAGGGGGLRLLSGTLTSPTLLAQIQSLLQIYPQARWHRFDPVGRNHLAAGARLAFDQSVDAIYDFERADVIVSLESNFLFEDAGSLAYARQFIRRRRVGRRNDPNAQVGRLNLNRLFVAEASPTITGAMADSRLPVRSSRIAQLALAMLGINGGQGGLTTAALLTAEESRWVAEVQQQLEQHRGRSLIIAGDSQPPLVHAMAHAMNHALGNVGTTVRYVAPVAPPPSENETLEALCRDIDAGQVDTLIILDSNPVYTAPADLDFVRRIQRVRLRVHHGLYHDETAFYSHWHVPMSHYLESWSDIRAFDGTPSVIQPLIQPLYNTRTPHELLAALLGLQGSSSYEIVRDYWRTRLPQERFEQAWREALHQGFVTGDAAQSVDVSPNLQAIVQSLRPAPAPATQPVANESDLEIVFRPDPSIWDGEYANNPWLQELPKPLNKLTWDNAACISPATAQRLNLANEHLVTLSHAGRELMAAVFVVPGHADDCVSITLGYGRTARRLRVAHRTGFNAYAIRTSAAPWFGGGVGLKRVARSYPLATTQQHFNMEGREIVRTYAPGVGGEVADDAAHAGHVPTEEVIVAGRPRRVPLSIFPDDMPSDPPYREGTYQWGMSIDLSSCIGCNACIVACNAENNIPMVGKEGVRNGREMHWLRIDTYYGSDETDPAAHLRNPQTFFQPLPCMHCEKAPCEVVCPVAATSHSDEGINEMTYNRCIGTRYCSNNCPYKVRRFNFFEYNPGNMPPQRKMQFNPDVTVRSRGVMEKCTYCIQRIQQGRIEAQKQDRRLQDGEVITACAQACPTQAIIFGDITDTKSLVHQLKFNEPFAFLDYGLLDDTLGTRPRTTYLRKIVPAPSPSPGTSGEARSAAPSPGTLGEGRGEGSSSETRGDET